MRFQAGCSVWYDRFVRDLVWKVWFWQLAHAVVFAVLERIKPVRSWTWFDWRRLSDAANYLCFHGQMYLTSYLVATCLSRPTWRLLSGLGWAPFVREHQLLYDLPLPLQTVLFVITADFLKYWIHIALHKVPFLWTFHKTHHSVREDEMSFVVGARFHIVEGLFYSVALFIPLMLLYTKPVCGFLAGVVMTFTSYFTHANIDVGYRSWVYLVNSPRMHHWHHSYDLPEGKVWNYGTTLSIWDWIFRTAYLPAEGHAKRLGFSGQDRMPNHVLGHQLYPLVRRRSDQKK